MFYGVYNISATMKYMNVNNVNKNHFHNLVVKVLRHKHEN